jgi:hypothetical protein
MNNRLKAWPNTGKRFAKSLANVWLFLCLSVTLASVSGAAPARIEVMHGDVQKRAAGALRWDPVTPGEKVEEGATIKTGPNSDTEILTEQGHRFTIHSETTIEFTSLQADDTKTKLVNGRVLSQVHKLKEKQGFAIETPTAVCAVRGTEFETTAGDKGTLIAVYKGIVGVSTLGGGEEIALHAGHMTSVHNGVIETPRTIRKETHVREETALAHLARHEVGLDMNRAQVIASAAMERRLADYQEGKSLTDVNGQRVRLQEYIVRPAANQFKLVVLDERGKSQLDYFYYLGTFNQNLPADLSVALRQLPGAIGTAPSYYLTSYDMGQSNTQDSVHDTATGGHLVKITQDGQGNFILTDPSDPTNTRTIPAAQLQTDGTYKVYNPLADSFSVVSAAQVAANTHFGVYIPENDTFRDLAPTDTLWKTRFNTYEHDLDSVMKQSYSKTSGVSNVLTTNQDANWTYAGGFVIPVVQADPNNVDATVTNYYGDGTFESYRTVLIDDKGAIAPLSAFSGLSSGSDYKGELLNWNYEQQVSASEFQGRKIDLVVEPKIFIESGLIQ